MRHVQQVLTDGDGANGEERAQKAEAGTEQEGWPWDHTPQAAPLGYLEIKAAAGTRTSHLPFLTEADEAPT